MRFIKCKLDVGALLFADAKAQAAATRIGIAIDKPLEIRIDMHLGNSVKISQEQLEQYTGSNHTRRLHTAYFLEQIVKNHIVEARRHHRETDNMNVFVGMLQKAARHVVELSTTCAVCGEEKWDEASPYCEKTVCEATFTVRAAVGCIGEGFSALQQARVM